MHDSEEATFMVFIITFHVDHKFLSTFSAILRALKLEDIRSVGSTPSTMNTKGHLVSQILFHLMQTISTLGCAYNLTHSYNIRVDVKLYIQVW